MESDDHIGFYWSNTNYYWDNDTLLQKMALDLIFPSKSQEFVIFYQSSPNATAINIFGCVE